MKTKYFKDNNQYFKFLNKMKNRIEIINVDIKKNIKVNYKLNGRV